MPPLRGLGAAACLALLAAAACSPEGINTSPEVQSAAFSDGPQPAIRLISPRAGEVFGSDAILVEVAVAGFTIDAGSVGAASAPGRGHWHLYLDGAFVATLTELHYTLRQVPPGARHLRVALANNDHSPLTPPAEDSVVIEVRRAAPQATGASEPALY